MNLNINAVRLDGNTQRRKALSQPKIMEYLERMKEGDEFPLINVKHDGKEYWLVGGFHRYHAMKLLGLKVIQANVTKGTLLEAQIESLLENGTHGLPLTNEEKREKVIFALTLEGFDKKTDYEIAKYCQVSQPFVAGIRQPEKKEKQKNNRDKSSEKKVLSNMTTNPISSKKETHSEIDNAIKELPNGAAPDEDEIRASELALQADHETLYNLLESDEPLKVAHEEIKKLHKDYADLEVRFHGLMNERNEAVKIIKDLQKQLDKIRKSK